jgi:pimeloyl-ACP methyl ester carboxylesterase
MPAGEGRPPAGHVPPDAALPVVLIPGLLTSARLFAGQLPALWRYGPVMVADNTQSEDIGEVAAQVLAAAPPRFALAGLSMGGYIALEIMRQAPGRVARLALLDTSARPDAPEASRRRLAQIAKAEAGRFAEIPDEQWPLMAGPAAREDAALRETFQLMCEETGPAAFARQQRAIISRPDSRPHLAAIDCPTLVLVGDGDVLTPPDLAAEMAAAIPGARHVVIPGSGHLSTLEQPALVTSALQDWLR